MELTAWNSLLSYEEKEKALFNRQKKLLDHFLEIGAITQREYDESYNTILLKMNVA